METIKIQELKEQIRYYSLYASMFTIVVFLTLIMDLYPTNIVLINSLVIAITIVSFIALIYVLLPLIKSVKELKSAINTQSNLEYTLRRIKIDKVLLDLDYQVKTNEEEKNNKTISEILNIL